MVFSQETKQEEFEASEIQINTFDREKWKKGAGELVYEKEEEKEKKELKPDKFTIPEELLPIIKVTSLILIAGILIFLLYRIFGNKDYLNKKLDKSKLSAELLDNLEDHIHEVDFDKLLEEALAANDFQAACRILYLKSIKIMADDELIFWKKEKTNANYLQEIKEHFSLFKLFFRLTRVYEETWYGNKLIDQHSFNITNKDFNTFFEMLSELRNSKETITTDN